VILGIDIGTSSITGVLCSGEDRAVQATVSACNDASAMDLPPGHHEQSPERILAIALDVIHCLVRRATGPIEGIALTGQMHGIVIVDEELNPLTQCITWQDARTSGYPAGVVRHSYASETGCFLHAGYGGLTLHHMLRTGAMPKGAFKALSVPGFVASHLSGRCTIDETLAASWGIWDVRKNRWHEALLEDLRIPMDLLPEWVPSCTRIGQVIGGQRLPSGTMVYSPLGDNQAGVANLGASQALVNIGTSSQLSVPLHEYAFDPKLETRPFPGGRFIQTFAVLCGGWSYAYLAGFFRQVIEQIGERPIELGEVYARMNRIASGAVANGLRIDTRFAGERNGNTECTGSISGITMDNLTPRNLARAFAEGIANELADAATVVDLRGVNGLTLVGNAVRLNPALRDALLTRFGMPCHLADVPEEAAFGAVRTLMDLNTKVRRDA